jgi:hypothetical protein
MPVGPDVLRNPGGPARPLPKTGRGLTARRGEVCGSSGSATDTTLFQC